MASVGNGFKHLAATISPPWNSDKFEGEFRLSLASDSDGQPYKQPLAFARGTPLPPVAFVRLEGGTTSPKVTTQLTKNIFEVELDAY
jgi:hypothetical protein